MLASLHCSLQLVMDTVGKFMKSSARVTEKSMPPLTKPGKILSCVVGVYTVFETIAATVIQAVTARAFLVPLRFLDPEALVDFGRKSLTPTDVHDVTDF